MQQQPLSVLQPERFTARIWLFYLSDAEMQRSSGCPAASVTQPVTHPHWIHVSDATKPLRAQGTLGLRGLQGAAAAGGAAGARRPASEGSERLSRISLSRVSADAVDWISSASI